MNKEQTNPVSNYDIMKYNTQKLFMNYDQNDMIRRWKLKSDETYLYADLLGRACRIRRSDGWVESEVCPDTEEEELLQKQNTEKAGKQTGEWQEAEFHEAMILYDLLCYGAENTVVSGDLVPIQNLSAVQNASSFAGQGMYIREERYWDGRTRELTERCERLHGVKWGRGDVSYRFRVSSLCGLEIALQFWESDEEFPASISVFADRNTKEFMHYETLWYLAGCLMDRLRS